MIGSKIREARISLGLTQEDVAGDHFSRSFISAIERGKVNPSAESIRRIAHTLRKPISYFLPDERDAALRMARLQLNEVEAQFADGAIDRANALISAVGQHLAELSPELSADYYRLLALAQRKAGQLLLSVGSSQIAAERYLELGDCRRAWLCRYSSAHALFTAGLYDHALETGLKSLESIIGKPEYLSEQQETHYLIGSSAYARGSVAVANHHFDIASSMGVGTDPRMTVRALLGRASCAIKAKEWKLALGLSERAARLACEVAEVELRAESYMCAAACLVQLDDVQQADRLIEQIRNLRGLDTSLIRKAYREYLSALVDVRCLDKLAHPQSALEKIVNPEQVSKDWQDVKDRWVLAKSKLIQSPNHVKETVHIFVELFEELGRYRDASEVLRFGAALLEEQGNIQAAYEMLKQAIIDQDKV